MSLLGRAKAKVTAASGRAELDALVHRLDELDEAVAENAVLGEVTGADLDILIDQLVARAARTTKDM